MNKRKIIIIAIIVAALAIAAATITFFVSNAADQQIDGSFFIAKYKGDGGHKVTITVKGDLPEDTYWHVQNLNGDVAAAKIKKEKKNKFVVTLDAVNQGQTEVVVFADNYEQSIDKLNVQNRTMINSNGDNNLQANEYTEIGDDYDASLVVNFTINCDEDKKFQVEEFYMGETFTSIPLMSDMPYPAYFGYNDEHNLTMLMKDTDDAWSVTSSDSKIVKISGPVTNENGTMETEFTGRDNGEAIIQVKNVKYETGFEFTVSSSEKTAEEEGTKAYQLNVTGAKILTETADEENHQKNVAEAKEVDKDFSIPDGAKVDKCEKYSYDSKKDSFVKGNDVLKCRILYKKASYQYSVAKKKRILSIKRDFNWKGKAKNAKQFSMEIGDKKISGYTYKNDEGKESIFARWEKNGMCYALSTEEGKMEELKAFIEESKPVEIKESDKTDTDDNENLDSDTSDSDNNSDDDVIKVDGGVIYKGVYIYEDSMWILDEMKELENGQE